MQKMYLQWYIAAKGFVGLQRVCDQLLIIIFFAVSNNPCCYWLKSILCLLFFSIQQVIKSITSKKFANLWSHKDSFLDFCFTKSCKLLNLLGTCFCFVQSFYKFFISPSLMCKSGNKIFWESTRGWMLDLFLFWLQ